jgi:hypothetical protein
MPIIYGGRGKLLGGAALVPWYLAGGIPAANCVAAYAAIGAGSQALSYVNLANPGTYDLTAPVAAPTWDAGTGWKFNGTTQYLATGITPAAGWSWMVRYTVGAADNKCILGFMGLAYNYPWFCAWNKRYNGFVAWMNGDSIDEGVAPASGDHVEVATPTKGYLDNNTPSTDSFNNSFAGTPYIITIGCLNKANASVESYFNGYVKAIAFYNTAIDSAVGALITATNSIP